jgi:hypothetical protein
MAGRHAGAQHGHCHGESRKKSSHRNGPSVQPSQETNGSAAWFRGRARTAPILYSCIDPAVQDVALTGRAFLSRRSFLSGYSSASFRPVSVGVWRADDA